MLTTLLSAVGRPVAYYPRIARWLGGDISAAVFLCQFIYWRGKAGDREIYKTYAEIEAETGLSARVARRVAGMFKQRGHLSVVKKGMPARNFYCWNWSLLDEEFANFCTTSSDESSPQDTPDGDHQWLPIVTTTSETTAETTPEKQNGAQAHPSSPPYEEIISYLNGKTGRAFSHKTEAYRRLIRTIWNALPQLGIKNRLAAFQEVVDVKTEQWGGDGKMSHYLRPMTLFQSIGKFETYLNESDRYVEWANGQRE